MHKKWPDTKNIAKNMESNIKNAELLIHGYNLVLTCVACPEQYDVFDSKGTQVGYLRLRHGSFTVSCPDYNGELVYQAYPKGDGIFEDDERIEHLTQAILAIQKHIANYRVDLATYS